MPRRYPEKKCPALPGEEVPSATRRRSAQRYLEKKCPGNGIDNLSLLIQANWYFIERLRLSQGSNSGGWEVGIAGGRIMELVLLFLFLLLSCLALVLATALHTGQCNAELGMESGAIPDDHITASSYFSAAVNGVYGRARVEAGGGAWCPRQQVKWEGEEHLEVYLGHLHLVTKVEVQGRFGNGQGLEFTEQYKLQYWRPGMEHWTTYTDGTGNQLLEGNSNTYLAQTSQLRPPVIAARVRFVPYSEHPRTVCMRVEVYGCSYTDGLLSYSMPDGDKRGGDLNLRDLTYDGSRQGGVLTGGLGQLTDGETGHTNFRVDSLGRGRGYEWVGWQKEERSGPIEITFQFQSVRNFSAIHIYTNNFFTKDTQVFSRARVLFSVGGQYYHAQPPVEMQPEVDRIFENARNVTIRFHDSPAKFVKLQLYFTLRWLLVSEVTFDSEPCRCNMTEETSPPVEQKDNNGPVTTTHPTSSDFVVGCLVALGVVLGVVPVAFCVLYYRIRVARNASKSPVSKNNSNTPRKVSMKMKDFNLMKIPQLSNAYSRAKGNLYGHVAMDDMLSSNYQTYKCPAHNPGYNSLAQPHDAPSSYQVPTNMDDSVEYAVPNMPPPMTSAPPLLPEVHAPSASQIKWPRVGKGATQDLDTIAPPTPQIPPPPRQNYLTASQVSQSPQIQATTGGVAFSVADRSIVTPQTFPEIEKQSLCVIETLGTGRFGTLQICEIRHFTRYDTQKFILKILNNNVDDSVRTEFQQELHILSSIDDFNVVRLVGASTQDPLFILQQYLEHGDLYQFLRRHAPENPTSSTSTPALHDTSCPVLSYGALLFIATQVASGMKHLEKLCLVHRDLATRNCLVGRGLHVKVSDIAITRPMYTQDYCRLGANALLPVRWMSWESILQGRFSSRSDVWSFGVTLWEILTMARQQPYAELSDDGVLENLAHCCHDDSDMTLLPQPPLCSRKMYDLMTACWRPRDRQRPPFWQVLMFLQRKHLGYTLDYPE